MWFGTTRQGPACATTARATGATAGQQLRAWLPTVSKHGALPGVGNFGDHAWPAERCCIRKRKAVWRWSRVPDVGLPTRRSTPVARQVFLRRVYDDPSPDDGLRILVDRMWPRGLTQDAAHFDEWIK